MANQQPDFAAAAQAHYQLGDQMALMGNTAIGGLAAVLQEIQRLRRDIGAEYRSIGIDSSICTY